MAHVGINSLKAGMKIEINKDPYSVVGVDFVKPGKGQPFTKVKVKHLLSGRVIEKTYRSGEKLELADVEEVRMRMLYKDHEQVTFMDDRTYDQLSVSLASFANKEVYLMEDILYELILYKSEVIDIIPPTFLCMKITETIPGVRGDTASGRVLKPAVTETGGKVQVPIFIEEGEVVKIDTRTGEYVGRG